VEARNALAAMKELDDKSREVITMRFVDDLGPQEIAAITGESDNVISVRLHRGLKKLKEILEP
jgi:RNA polymerase sigma-70 factor (ECF subfamily)